MERDEREFRTVQNENFVSEVTEVGTETGPAALSNECGEDEICNQPKPETNHSKTNTNIQTQLDRTEKKQRSHD